MSLPEWLDEYFHLANPDWLDWWQREQAPLLTAQIFERLGISSETELEAKAHEASARIQAWRESEIAKLDLSILEFHDIGLQEFQLMIADRRAKRKGGSKRITIAPDRTRVFKSFIESEKNGASFAEAVNAAKLVAPRVTEKSIRTWLQKLIECGLNKTALPTRKKTSSDGKS